MPKDYLMRWATSMSDIARRDMARFQLEMTCNNPLVALRDAPKLFKAAADHMALTSILDWRIGGWGKAAIEAEIRRRIEELEPYVRRQVRLDGTEWGERVTEHYELVAWKEAHRMVARSLESDAGKARPEAEPSPEERWGSIHAYVQSLETERTNETERRD